MRAPSERRARQRKQPETCPKQERSGMGLAAPVSMGLARDSDGMSAGLLRCLPISPHQL